MDDAFTISSSCQKPSKRIVWRTWEAGTLVSLGVLREVNATSELLVGVLECSNIFVIMIHASSNWVSGGLMNKDWRCNGPAEDGFGHS